VGERGRGDILALHGADEADAAFDRAVIERNAGRWNQDGRAVRLAVGHQNRAPSLGKVQRFRNRERAVAVLARDLEEPGLRAARAVRGDRAAVDDGEALGVDGFKAHLVGTSRDRAFNLRREKFLERSEDRVLQLDLQRQQPVEEGGDGREVLAQRAVTVEEVQSRDLAEPLERAASDMTSVEPLIELAEC
jgi:hypothetical protein